MTPETVELRPLLEHVLAGEPGLGDEVEEVLRRADRLRRRRARLLVSGGMSAAAALVLIGYLVTTRLLGHGDERPAVAPAPPATQDVVQPPATPIATLTASPTPTPTPTPVDKVLAVLGPTLDGKGKHLVAGTPSRGFGWREYDVVDPGGDHLGGLAIAVYTAKDEPCLPRPADRTSDGCANPRPAGNGVQFVRYDDANDPDWQVNEVIGRRVADGRTIVVMATGERGADDPEDGRPGLSAAQVQAIATDGRVFAAFGAGERCDVESAANACPVFKVSLPGR